MSWLKTAGHQKSRWPKLNASCQRDFLISVNEIFLLDFLVVDIFTAAKMGIVFFRIPIDPNAAFPLWWALAVLVLALLLH